MVAEYRQGPRPFPEGDDGDPKSMAVNNDINSSILPGIAQRDRYFVITVEDAKLNGVAYQPLVAGSVPVRTTVSWPYRLPEGPAISFGSPFSDPSRLIAEQNRQQLVFFFSLPP